MGKAPVIFLGLSCVVALSLLGASLQGEDLSAAPDIKAVVREFWPDMLYESLESLSKKQGLFQADRVLREAISQHKDSLSHLPSSELDALARLHSRLAGGRSQFAGGPAVKIRRDAEDGITHVIAIDVSGRSRTHEGPEFRPSLWIDCPVEWLSDFECFSELKALFLFDLNLQDGSLECLAKLPRLRYLWIAPSVDNSQLPTIGTPDSLEYLDCLGAERITPEGIVGAFRGARVRAIRLHSPVDPAGLARLKTVQSVEVISDRTGLVWRRPVQQSD